MFLWKFAAASEYISCFSKECAAASGKYFFFLIKKCAAASEKNFLSYVHLRNILKQISLKNSENVHVSFVKLL